MRAWVGPAIELGQSGLPQADEVADPTYYEPSGHGFESDVASRMAEPPDGHPM